MEGLMTTNASGATKRQAEVPMADLAKDVGLEHKVGPDRAQRSFKQTIGKLFGRVQSESPKTR
jgi:hypothetical protein